MTLKELFGEDSYDKQLNIATDKATYTNEELQSENLELTETLCSEETLRFGCCEASIFKVRILNNIIPLKNKWITVSMMVSGTEVGQLTLGKYKVDSDKPTANRKYRDIVAYDAMYDIINADVAAWYNELLPKSDSTVTLKKFRTSFLTHFGVEQENVTLVNDDMVVAKTIEPTSLSGKTVITAICEINGCFGHIGRNGKFQYVHLQEMREGVYPSDTLYPRDDLYPADPINVEQIKGSHYINATYEDFTTARINKLQIRQEEDDIGCIYGSGTNCYIVQDNFLVYGKSAEDLETIAANLYSVICKVWYRPAHVEAKGNPCLEVGDGIKLRATNMIIYTYILQRTLKGIQALRDIYDAEGEQYQSEDVNSVHESIIQLKGKTNILTRTVEETKSSVKNVEAGLQTEIEQRAQAIEISATDIKNNIVSYINVAPGTVTIKSDKIDLVGLVNAKELVTKFATIATLNATKADLNELIAEKATIKSLNATNATIENLKINKLDVSEFTAEKISAMEIEVKAANVTGKLTASQIDATNLKVAAANITGTLTASQINADNLKVKAANITGTLSVSQLDVSGFATLSLLNLHAVKFATDSDYINYRGKVVEWRQTTINGVTIQYLGGEAEA